MSRIARLRAGTYGVLIANVGARVAALVALALSTVLVAWTGGPTAVGIYALARVMPGLVGVVMSSGLPGAVPYFLGGPHRDDRRLPLTLLGMALVGGAVGTALWTAASPLLGSLLFPDLSLTLVLLTGLTVLTQLLVATAKACSQGSDDLPGANRVIVNEELLFLPAYGLLWLAGVHGYEAAVAGLLLADVAAFALGWRRLIRRGFFRSAARPSVGLARRVAAYGLRAQLGGVIFLLNLRLDFILLSALAGPAVLGIYAVASKFAELVKIPGMALTYVLYPQYAREGPDKAPANARRVMRKAGLGTAVAIVPLGLSASFVIPAVYGDAFEPAIVPAQIILIGLSLEGVTGVITGFLYGVGRPGLNSWAMAAGLLVTVALDLALIPPFGAIGAAVASAAAYLIVTLALVSFFWWLGRSESHAAWSAGSLSRAGARSS
jgi:O-antigen/teichoic acid export membrane protein